MDEVREDPRQRLTAHVSPGQLVDLAGPASYDRGRRYFEDGRVTALRFYAGGASGEVVGTYPYDVGLVEEDGGLAWACSCPAAEDGSFCKHLVAFALTIGDPDASATSAGSPGVAPAGDTWVEALRGHLSRKAIDELVELLVELTLDDPRLEDRFRLEIALAGPDGPDLRTYRRVIDDSTRIRDFVPYGGSFGYARQVEESVAAIATLLEEGHPSAVIDLAEHALARLEQALNRMDDSSGLMGPIIEDLEALHLAACERVRPDPRALARRLFERQIEGDWDVFDGAALTYREVLGAEGLETYRRLAAERWADVPALAPGERDPEGFGSRFRITRIMEALAQAEADLDGLVDVMTRDLSSAYRYLRIAELLTDAGEEARALEWAERGLAEAGHDGRLSMFVAEAYLRSGREDDAVAMTWKVFARTPRLDGYLALRRHAKRAAAWPEWRERAIDLLRAREDRSELVRVLLEEGEAEAAWDEACEGGCTEDLWLRLAETRSATHPADAIPIYQRAVERAIDRKDKPGYREAVELMRTVEDLMGRTDGPDAFATYVADVRSRHARKRNLMALLG